MTHWESAEISKIMSASIAPVFLISGIGGILSIMSLRYGRVVDRIRTLLRDGPKLYQKELGEEHMNRELRILYKRARLLRVTIIFEVFSVFCISATIFAMFLSLSLNFDVYFAPQALFMAALGFFIVGLGLFIQDYAMSLRAIEDDMEVRSSLDVQTQQSESIFKAVEKGPTTRY
jgi:hypothetical protein